MHRQMHTYFPLSGHPGSEAALNRGRRAAEMGEGVWDVNIRLLRPCV